MLNGQQHTQLIQQPGEHNEPLKKKQLAPFKRGSSSSNNPQPLEIISKARSPKDTENRKFRIIKNKQPNIVKQPTKEQFQIDSPNKKNTNIFFQPIQKDEEQLTMPSKQKQPMFPSTNMKPEKETNWIFQHKRGKIVSSTKSFKKELKILNPIQKLPPGSKDIKQSPIDPQKKYIIQRKFSQQIGQRKDSDQDRSFDVNGVKIGELIGEGAYGKVYRGLLLCGKFVAVKKIMLKNEDNHTIQALSSEISLLQKLSHKNIVKYYGCNQEKDNVNIYLEYMSGGSIASRLKQYGKFTEELIKKFVAQVLQGLIYLHSQGVVHRDLKGGNILSDEKGNVKLADFGAARIMDFLPFQNASQTEFCDSIKGSLYWMAPELLQQQPHGRRIDVWSLGCTILEMATGTHPWETCKSFTQLVCQVVTKQCPPIPSHLSPECQDFIKQCCLFDKNQRPKSIALEKHPWLRSTPVYRKQELTP